MAPRPKIATTAPCNLCKNVVKYKTLRIRSDALFKRVSTQGHRQVGASYMHHATTTFTRRPRGVVGYHTALLWRPYGALTRTPRNGVCFVHAKTNAVPRRSVAFYATPRALPLRCPCVACDRKKMKMAAVTTYIYNGRNAKHLTLRYHTIHVQQSL